jgi:hypothetical protein
MSKAEQIADAVQNVAQPAKIQFNILDGTRNQATFTEKTSEYSTEEVVWFLCKPDQQLANEVMHILERRLEKLVNNERSKNMGSL